MLSRFAFWWAALAVLLSVLMPPPLGTWVAALAVAGAALSLIAGRLPVGRSGSAGLESPALASAATVEEAGLLDIAAMVVRSAAHSHNLPEALHGAARILFQELGADGLVTGRFDEAGALLRLDRFIDQAAHCPAPPREPMSAIATEATASQRVAGSLERGFAVPVLRDGRPVGWLEFTAVQMSIATPALLQLLDLVRRELSAVAERTALPVAAAVPASVAVAPVGSGCAPPETARSGALLTRYLRPQAQAQAHAQGDATGGNAVLDQAALSRLRELDPSGVNRLLERVVKAFESSATRLIPQLREGARVRDVAGVRQVANALKCASASVGAVKLSRMCADIEVQERAESAEDLGARVKSMVAEIDIVLSVLRSLPVPRT